MVRALKAIWWYISEVSGENDYKNYCRHLAKHHPERSVPTEREYWKARWAEQGSNPGARCC